MDRVLLTQKELERIDQLCNEEPKLTNHMKQYINRLGKKDETETTAQTS
jgi:hypothetical protein